MALVTTYRYETANWTQTDWHIGDNITEQKMDNLERGVAIALSVSRDILAELGAVLPTDATTIEQNATRIDNLQEWITGGANSGYSGTNIATRLSNMEGANSAQDNRLNLFNMWFTGEINTEYELEEKGAVGYRLNALETKISTIANEFGDSFNTSNAFSGNTRLDALEAEIGGTINNNKDGYDGSRIDNLQSWITGAANGSYNKTSIATRLDSIEEVNTNQTTKLNTIQKWIIGEAASSYGSTNSIESRLIAIENEITGASGNNFNNSRIDNLQTWIAGSSSGSYDGNKGSIETRLNNIQKWITDSNSGSYSGNAIVNRLSAIESTNSTQNSNISNLQTKTTSIATEIWDSDTTSGNSRIDNIQKWITGSESGSYENNKPSIAAKLNTLDTQITAINGAIGSSFDSNNVYTTTTRIDDLEKEICGATITRDTNGGYSGSRIDNLQLWITGNVNGSYTGFDSSSNFILKRLENIDGINTTQNSRISTLENEIWSDGNTLMPSKLDNVVEDTENFRNYIAAMQYVLSTSSDRISIISDYDRATGLIHRVNEIEGAIRDLSASNNFYLNNEVQESIGLEYSETHDTETVIINDVILERQICFVILRHAVTGRGKLSIRFNDGESRYVYFRDLPNPSNNDIVKTPMSEGHILGVYRKPNTNNLYLFNAPIVM